MSEVFELTKEEIVDELDKLDSNESARLKELFQKHYTGFWEFQKYMDDSEDSGYSDEQMDVKLIAYAMYLLIWGYIRILVVSMPTRRRKSHAANDAIKYKIGFMPTRSNSRYSYSGDLVKQHSKIIRRDIQSDKYRTVFPEIKLRSDSKSVWDWSVEQAVGDPTFRCAGMDGASTGFGVNGLSIIDDLIKGFKSAFSPTDVSSRKDFISGCFDTREEKGLGKLYTATRWAENDPTGNLLKYAKKIFKFDAYNEELTDENIERFIENILSSEPTKNDVVYISIPALNNKGQTTCPYSDLRTTEYYQNIMDTEIKKGNAHSWYSLFQQEPRPKGSMLFDNFSNWYYIKDLGKKHFSGGVSHLDPAGKGSNNTCCIIGKTLGNDVYVLPQMVYTPEQPKVSKELLVEFFKQNHLHFGKITGEANGGGDQYCETLNERLVEAEVPVEFDDYNILGTDQNKELKIFLSSDWILSHVWLPAELDEDGNRQYEVDSPTDRAIKALTKYVGKVEGYFVRNQEDDFLDCLCGIKDIVAEEDNSFSIGYI